MLGAKESRAADIVFLDSTRSLYVPLPSPTLQGPIVSVRRFVVERT